MMGYLSWRRYKATSNWVVRVIRVSRCIRVIGVFAHAGVLRNPVVRVARLIGLLG